MMTSSSSSTPFGSPTTLIFDLGDVLWTWSGVTNTTIPPRTMKAISRSEPWHAYECSQVTQAECYRLVCEQFNLDPMEFARAVDDAHNSLVANEDFVGFIRSLKEESGGSLRVFAMSNISKPDYQVLRSMSSNWDVFEDVFTSGDFGLRKPDVRFFEHVLEQTGADPRRTVFVDDKLVNVDAARSLGIQGIVWDSAENVQRTLLDLVDDTLSPPPSPAPMTPPVLPVDPSYPVPVAEESGDSFRVDSTADLTSCKTTVDVVEVGMGMDMGFEGNQEGILV